MPTAKNERKKIKIESEKVEVPTAQNERRKIKIDTEIVKTAEPRLREPKVVEKIEETVIDKRTIKERMIEIWLNENKAKSAESLSFIAQKSQEDYNKMTEEYEIRITELETNIREKDDELNQMVAQLQAIEERKNFLDLDSYSLNIISDKQPWNNIVQHCPINTLYVESERRDWNELNEISQLDLSIISLGKNWDETNQEEGRDGVFLLLDSKKNL